MSKRKFFFRVLMPILIFCNASFSQKDYKFYKSYKGDLKEDFKTLRFQGKLKENQLYKQENNYFKVIYLNKDINKIQVLNHDAFVVEEYKKLGKKTSKTTFTKTTEGVLTNYYYFDWEKNYSTSSVLTKLDDKKNEIEAIEFDVNKKIITIHQKKYNQLGEIIEEITLDGSKTLSYDDYGCATRKFEYDQKGNCTDVFCFDKENKIRSKTKNIFDINGIKSETCELKFNSGKVFDKHISKFDKRGNIIETIDSTESYYWINIFEFDQKNRLKKSTKIDNDEISIYYYSKRNIETKRGKKQLQKKYACFDKNLRPCNCAFTNSELSDNYSIKKSKFNRHKKVKKEIYLDTNNQLTFWIDNSANAIYAPISKFRYFQNGELKSQKTYDKFGKLFSEISYDKNGVELNLWDNLTFDKEDKTKYSKYEKVQIKEQIWMAENLSVEKFRNGDPILQAETNEEWIQAFEKGIPAWCYSYHYSLKIGKLYNIYAVTDTRGLAPKNWHVPSSDEMETLVKNLGGKDSAFNQLIKKEAWNHNEYLKNSYTKKIVSFNALPTGYRDFMGEFNDFNHFAFWGSTISQQENKKYLVSFSLHQSPEEKGLDIFYHVWDAQGYSVRCVKD